MTNFTMNGKTYSADTETMKVLRSAIPGAKKTGDSSAVACIMILGLRSGSIREIA